MDGSSGNEQSQIVRGQIGVEDESGPVTPLAISCAQSPQTQPPMINFDVLNCPSE